MSEESARSSDDKIPRCGSKVEVRPGARVSVPPIRVKRRRPGTSLVPIRSIHTLFSGHLRINLAENDPVFLKTSKLLDKHLL
jgi:hypothetical protein